MIIKENRRFVTEGYREPLYCVALAGIPVSFPPLKIEDLFKSAAVAGKLFPMPRDMSDQEMIFLHQSETTDILNQLYNKIWSYTIFVQMKP
jgi:hypothetical protein